MISATAAVVRGPGAPFRLEPVLLDEPRPEEVLVRITAAGICHTDLSARAGHTPVPLPAVLGHEGTGVVERIGRSVTGLRPGQPVVLTFTSCGRCPNCRTAQPIRCEHWPRLNLFGGARADGSPTLRAADGSPLHGHFFGQSCFATHALVTARNAIPVPDGVPPERLAPFGCGVQTGAGAVLNVLRPKPGWTLVVYGAGAVGLAALLAARLSPATGLIAVDVRPERLALARELGATAVVDAGAGDPAEAVRELTAGRGAECVLETSGSLAALAAAVRSLAVGGTCAVVGAPPRGSELGLDVSALLDRTPVIVGVNQGASLPGRFLPALVDLHLAGRLPVDRLVRTYPFAEVERAAAAGQAGGAVKPVLVMD
ncbi:NAD(P)-dependent alcohol dehydrogenase [Kitasatospora sp. NPDC096147]|uniref:NAD(P)-dependent alcohol dehydrogenase n=1 Tax=Kitasatospora sp. NPDC096147 TaxID=3364093 RepID=UPI0038299EB9